MSIISGSIGSLLKTSGLPMSASFDEGVEYTVSLLNGPGYLTIESKRDSNGFYTSSANFSSVSSSNMVDRSLVASDFIASAYLGYNTTGSLVFTPARSLSPNELKIRVVSPNDIIYVDAPLATFLESLLSSLRSRSEYYENNDGVTLILQQFENCTI